MRALALFSGGLDSLLAMKIVKDQGIEVIAVHVNIGFGSRKNREEHLKNLCGQIGVQLHILHLEELYIDEVLLDPKYGYGKNFNPCIDCHGFMFRHSAKLLEYYNAAFMISGEIVGQRPMSQTYHAMQKVADLSQSESLIVRPMCAKLLPPTKPELQGWIDREKLLDIHGRNRKKQLAMAQEIGLVDYDLPSGGCILTEVFFGKVLQDFIAHDSLEVSDIDTLKFGRHFRLPEGAKIVIGRNETDNKQLEKTTSQKFFKAYIKENIGPMVLVDKKISSNDLSLATQIIVTYGKTTDEKEYEVAFCETLFDEVFVHKAKKASSKTLFQDYLIMI